MPVQQVAPDTLLGERYRIERELGRGGMATVYLARDLRQDRQVAIKVLHPDLSVALGPERFRREIHLASRLSHPHILPISDSGEAGGSLYFVMPYVPGESLAARLIRERQLAVDESIRIACEVAEALDHAHRQGIIHRDIKPENILLEDGQAIVADFGIARAISESGDDKLTQTGVTLGTPAYMSPEQAMAERELDGRSDIYSLGCVLYEMLAGHPPFVGPTAQAIIARQMVGEVPSLTVVRGSIPEEVEDAVLRALSKVPADRFKTAQEFADALRASQESGGRTLGRAERRKRSRRDTPGRLAWWRSTPAIALGVASVLVLGGGVAWRALHRGSGSAAAGAGASADAGLPPQRVAVMYFDDLSSDQRLEPLSNGLTEDLIHDLNGVKALDVVSRDGVAAFRAADVPADSIARALGAGTIVRGSVEPTGDSRVHVAVRLIDGASGVDVKRASFEYPAGNLLAIRDSIVSNVAVFLRERIGQEVRVREAREGTRNAEAWTLLQRADRLVDESAARDEAGDTTRAWAALRQADSLLVRSIALDPKWVDPVILRGRVALRAARLSRDDRPGESRHVDSALAAAERAIALAPDRSEPYELRGTARYRRWDHHLEPDPRKAAELLDQAQSDLKQATTLDPSNARAWYALAGVYYQKTDPVDGTLATRRAYEEDAYLDEASDILWRLYSTSYDNEQFMDAVHWCDEGRRRFPKDARFVGCQLWLFTTKARQPDVAGAWALLEEDRKLTPPQDWAYQGREAQMLVAAAIGRAGLKDSADHLLVRSRADASIDPDRELLGTEAVIRVVIGEKDEALRLLKEYVTAKPEHRAGFATTQSWWWRDLKSDPRWKELTGQ